LATWNKTEGKWATKKKRPLKVAKVVNDLQREWGKRGKVCARTGPKWVSKLREKQSRYLGRGSEGKGDPKKKGDPGPRKKGGC